MKKSHPGVTKAQLFLCNMEVTAPLSYPGLHRTVSPLGGLVQEGSAPLGC